MYNSYTDDNQDDIEVVDIKEDTSSSNISGAAMPDIQALLRGGYITVDPKTGLPDTPQNPVKKKLIRTHKGNGSVEERIVMEYGGHVMDPKNPSWRIGLNAEMYYEYLEMERTALLKGRPENIAPVLTETEFDSFKEWLLENKGIDIENENIAIPEVVAEVKARKAAINKKKIESGDFNIPTKTTTSSKAKKVVVEEKDDSSDNKTDSKADIKADDDLADL